jgi:hypothetical protein
MRRYLILILAKCPADLTPFRRGDLVQNVEQERKIQNLSDHGIREMLEAPVELSRSPKLIYFEFLYAFFPL